ncbi:MAG: hypothetical protein K0R28_750, partial [Paenibacillus sp.]|nr:hypothetical protein [Paenibacillus sp.]
IVYRNDMFISSATKVFIEYLKQTFRIPEEVRL